MEIVEATEMRIETIKKITQQALIKEYKKLKAYTNIDRANYETEKEYQEALVKKMTELTEQVRKEKLAVFRKSLDSYNDFLENRQEAKKIKKEITQTADEQIKLIDNEIRHIGIMTAALAIFFPTAIPLILMTSIPRIAERTSTKKKFSQKKEKTTLNDKELRDLQDIYYDFIDTLRTDYHTSNQELAEIMKQAEQGENIIPNLLEIINPERVNLPLVDLSENDKQQNSSSDNQSFQKQITYRVPKKF